MLLCGVGLTDAEALDAGRSLAAKCDPPDDHRASSAYRRRVLPELARRAVRAACQRAQR
jgi:CO/xanthine dehydrogenase FAD-binding subunit